MSEVSSERVRQALLHGRERSARYEYTTPDGVKVYGTVAVIKQGDALVVGWEELRADTYSMEEPDVEGKETFPTMEEAERFLASKFKLNLSDLGPSRGNRFFPE